MWIESIHEAKTHLSELIQHAIHGEEVVICKAGIPIVSLHPYETTLKRRVPGMWKGKVFMSDDFEELPGDIMKYFQGEGE